MAQPTPYSRATDFTDRDGDDTNHTALNAEFDAAELTLDQICHNLALIQQDDGNLRQGIVGADALAPSAFDRVLGSVNEAVLSADAAANAAMQEAAAAKQSADNAATQAGAAASHAVAASGSAANARQSATDAAQSVATAGGIAEQVARDVVSPVVSQVEQARTAAQQAAANAAQAQQLAQQAANSAAGALSVSAGDARYVPKSHLSDGDPHSQYANKAQTSAAIAAAQSAATTAGDRIASHEAFADPHSQYLLKTSAGNLATTNTNQEITAVKQFLCANANIENTTGSLAGLEIRGRGGAAFLAFHRPGAHACYLGIDSDDQLKIGGWSRGAVKYPLLHPTSATAPGSAPCYAPRSWGSFTFNGAGNVSLYALGNVSSVVSSSNNTVTVNFIVPMPDGTYAVVFHAHGQPGAYVSSRIAGGFTISGLTSSSNINFAVFR